MEDREPLPWKAEYVLGVPEVDRQHQELFHIINRLRQTPAGAPAEHAAKRAIEGLVHYSRYHFSTEEAFMLDIGYPDADLQAHNRQHQQFVRKVEELSGVEHEGRPVAEAVAEFVYQWFTRHIPAFDLRYVEAYRRKKGA
jgi:hemerythrin